MMKFFTYNRLSGILGVVFVGVYCGGCATAAGTTTQVNKQTVAIRADIQKEQAYSRHLKAEMITLERRLAVLTSNPNRTYDENKEIETILQEIARLQNEKKRLNAENEAILMTR